MVHAKHDLRTDVCSKMLETFGRQVYGAQRREETGMAKMVGWWFITSRYHFHSMVPADVYDNSSGKFFSIYFFFLDLVIFLPFRLPTS